PRTRKCGSSGTRSRGSISMPTPTSFTSSTSGRAPRGWPSGSRRCCAPGLTASSREAHVSETRDDTRWEAWGPLRERYQTRAAAGGPHRVLALDGGGIRGLITLPVLVRLEALLRRALGRGDDFRLCEFFDCIGGTSTGAIIATGLARGLSARELLEFYRGFGEEVFRKRPILERWRALYDNGPLER